MFAAFDIIFSDMEPRGTLQQLCNVQ